MSEVRNDAFEAMRDAIAAAKAAPFVPGPPVPAPPPQDWPAWERRIVERELAGDEPPPTTAPTLEQTLRADNAASLWPTPIRSSSDTDRFGKDAIGGGDGRAYDPHRWRDEHILRLREYDLIAASLPVTYGLTGTEQKRVWWALHVGLRQDRNIHAGIGLDAIAREEARATKRADRGGKRRKREAMEPPPPRKPFRAPECVPTSPAELAAIFREEGRFVTPQQLGIIKSEFSKRVYAACDRKGWPLRSPAHSKAEKARHETEGDMAGQYEVESWKEIAGVLNRSETTCKRYALLDSDPLPVVRHLGRVAARRADLLAWIERQAIAA